MTSARRNAETIYKQIERNETQQISTSKPVAQPELMEVTEELDENGDIVSSKVENFDKAVDEMTEVLKNHSVSGEKKSTPQSAILSTGIKDTGPASISSSGRNEPVTTLSLGRPEILTSDVAKAVGYSPDDESAEENVLSGGDHDIAQDIRHNLNTLGPIVAELDLEEDDDYGSIWDEEDDDLEENEYGMTNIRDQMDDEYILEMEALAKKHGMQNLGPDPTLLTEVVPRSILGVKSEKPAGVDQPQPPRKEKEKSNNRKGVRFAENLDISPHPETAQTSNSRMPREQSRVTSAPLSDVVEKQYNVSSPLMDTIGSEKKVSRFKAAKMADSGVIIRPSISQDKSRIGNRVPHVAGPNSNVSAAQDTISMKEELDLYSKRMSSPDHQPDMSVFEQDFDNGEDGVIHESSRKISRFKAARLGL